MSSRTPPPETPVATGVATGSLGTGTAVDDETTLMAVPEAPGPAEQPKAAATLPAAAPVTPATTHIAAERRVPSRRDPYRPIGIALAAILVALVGVAVLSSGGDTPAQLGQPPAASASPGNAVAGDEEEGDEDDDGNGGGNGNNGNGNGRGNGNGNGGGNGRGND